MSETFEPQAESIKPSKLDRVKHAATVTAIFAIPTAVTVAATYASTKNAKMSLEAAKLNLETAKLNNPS